MADIMEDQAALQGTCGSSTWPAPLPSSRHSPHSRWCDEQIIPMHHCCSFEAEHDPEDAWAGEELGLEETDEELDQPAKRCRSMPATHIYRMLSSRQILCVKAWRGWCCADRRLLCRPAAKEKALRLRGAIELDEQEYGGKTSSRKAIFGDDVLPASSNGFGCAQSCVCSSTEHDFSDSTESASPQNRPLLLQKGLLRLVNLASTVCRTSY